MPTWKCPKCGSTDSYDATELQQKVSGSGGGPSVGIIGNELGDTGINPVFGSSQKINVSSETVEVSVKKCRQCDTLLGDKDKIYSPEEAKQRARQAAYALKERRQLEKQKDNNCLVVFGLVASIFILGIALVIDCLVIHDFSNPSYSSEGTWLWLTWFTLHAIVYITCLIYIYEGMKLGPIAVYLTVPLTIFTIMTFFMPLFEGGKSGQVSNELIFIVVCLSLLILSTPTIMFIKWVIAPPKKKIQTQPKKENTSTTRIKCPNCASRNFTQHFEIPNELLGSKIECPKCLTKFIASKN